MSENQYINPYRQFVGSFIPNWLLRRSELSPGAKLCYARLAQFADKTTGIAWPKRETLARELGIGQGQVDRYVDELKDQALIRVKRRGLNIANEYRFLEHPWMNTTVTNQATKLSVSPNSPTPESSDTPIPESSHTRTQDSAYMQNKENQRQESNKKHMPSGSIRPAVPSSSVVKELIADFSGKFTAKTGKRYHVTWGKDSSLLNKLLASGNNARAISSVMDLYFADDFAARCGFDIGRFYNAYNQLNSATRSVTQMDLSRIAKEALNEG